MRVLIVEDEKLLAESLKTLLERKGFTVETAFDGVSGAEYAETGIYDLLILDVMMPDMDGYAVARQVRQKRCTVPILMLTAKSDLPDRIEGLNAGADYYLTKPFDIVELLACIRALLRRTETENGTLRCGILEVDPGQHIVRVRGQETILTQKEFEVLCLLLRNPGQVLSREQLIENVWGYAFTGESRTVDVHVRTLRQKLGEAGAYIETVRGYGYKISPVN